MRAPAAEEAADSIEVIWGGRQREEREEDDGLRRREGETKRTEGDCDKSMIDGEKRFSE
jgi:hypothetical protein